MRGFDMRSNRIVTVLGLLGLMILSTCSVNQVGLGAKVDITPPKVQITIPAEDGQYLSGDLELGGTAADDLGVTDLSITYPSAAGGDVVTKLAVSGGQWSTTLPTNTTGGLPEGKVTITVSATDQSGKVTTDSVLVYIDNKAPTVLVTSPVSYAALAKDAPQYTDSIDIKGEVYDPSPVPTGSVKARLLDWTRHPIPSQDDPTNGWVAADGTNTFSVRFVLKTGVLASAADGAGFYYQVQATDQAGNVNSYYYHRNDIYSVLPANTIFPAMNELGQIDQAGTGNSPISNIPFHTIGAVKGLDGIQLSDATGTSKMATFQYTSVSKPKIKFSNFDQTKSQTANALALNSVVSGTITPDANYGAVDPTSVKVEFWTPNAVNPSGPPVTIKDTDNTSMSDNIELLRFGDSLVFTVNLRDGATALQPGGYSIKVYATPTGSTEQSETGDFMIDDNAPILTETAVGTGALTSKRSTFHLSGKAKAGVDIKSITIYQAKDPETVLETQEQTVKTLGPFTGNVETDWDSGNLPNNSGDGTYYYVIKLETVSNKFATVFRTIQYDATAPVLTVTQPADAWVSTSALTLKGTADDGDGTGVSEVRVLVDNAATSHAADNEAFITGTGSPWKVATGTVSWSYDWPDLGSEGAKKVWVAAKDKAGNWTQGTAIQSLAFGLDLSAPSLTTTNKATYENKFVNAALSLTGTSSDPNGIQKLDYSIDGGQTYSSLSSSTTTDSTVINWTASVPVTANAAAEARSIRLRATDRSGKQTTDSFDYTIDTQAPSLTVSNLVDNQLVTSLTFTVSGTTSDNGGSGSAVVQTSLNGTSWTDATPSSGNWSASITSTDGLGKTLHLRARDTVGNVSTEKTIAFNLDSELPTTTKTLTPAPATSGSLQYERGPFTLSGTATDNLGVGSVSVSGTGTGSITVNGSAGDTSRTWSIPVTPSSDGSYTYTILVTDSATQTKTVTSTVIYDTTAPDLNVTTLEAPPATNPISSSTVTIRGNALDDNGVASVSYQLDGSTTWVPVTSAGQAWSLGVSGLSEGGSHNVRFQAIDKAGNTTVFPAATDDPFVFGLDLSPPTLTSNAATLNASPNQRANFSLNGTAQDNNGLKSVDYSLDGGTTWTSINGVHTGNATLNWNTTVTVPSNGSLDGQKALRIRTIDTFDKVTLHSASILFDATAPVLTIANTVDHQLITTLSYTVSGSVVDNGGSGVASVQVSKDGGTTWTNATITGSSWTAAMTFTEKLSQSLKIRATDVVGNVTALVTGTTDITVNVDTAPPTISNLTIPSGFAKSSFAMDFDLADTLDLASLTVTQSLNGGAPVTIPVSNLLGGTADTSKPAFGVAALGNEQFPRDPNAPGTHLINPEGEFEYVITVADAAGRAPVSVTRKLTVDSVKPSVSIINPAASATVNGKVTINAAASDANGIQSVKYLVRLASDGSALPLYSNAAWTTMGNAPYRVDYDTTALADGNWVVYVAAQDKAGNETLDEFTPFTTYQAADLPTVTLTNMNTAATSSAQANLNLFNTSSVTLTATVADDDDVDGGSVLVWANTVGSAAPTLDSQYTAVSSVADGKNVAFSHTFSGLPEGALKLYVKVKDKAASKLGLSSATTSIGPIYFAFDSANPALSVTNKSTYDGKAVNADFALTGTTSDANSVTKLEFSLNGGTTWDPSLTVNTPAATWSQTITVPAAGAADGVKSVQVRATDGFGKTSTQNLSVTFDTVVPTTPVIASFGSPYFDTQLNASGTTSDATSGVNKVQYSFNNSTWADFTGQDNWFGNLATTSLTEGSNTLYTRSIDRAGNMSPVSSAPFTIDRSNPVITESTYSGVVYKKAAFSFTVDVADGLSLSNNALTVTLDVNGSNVALSAPIQNTLNSKHHTYDFTVPITSGDGVYQITLHAVDSVGRSALTVTRTVTVDTAAPSLTIVNLNDGDLIQSSNLTVQGTASDGSGSGVKRVQYKLNGAASWTDATGSTNWAAALSGLADGLSQSIVFQSEDNSGNVSSSTVNRSFLVDLAAPALAETASGLGASLVYRNAAVSLGGAATDGNGVSHVTVSYQKDGGAAVNALDDTNNDGSWAWALAAPADHSADGLYDITVSAVDGAGRSTSLARRIQIDTKSPDLTISSPAASELVATTAQKIQGQVTDNSGRGVTTLEYSKNSTNGTNGTWVPITLTGLNWSVNNVDFSAGGEGAKTLWVRATDGINPTTAASVSFNYDTQAPTLTETAINSATQIITNTATVYSGNAADTNALAQLRYTVNGGAPTVIPVAGDGSWSLTFPNTTEGSFALVFQAVDAAGRTTSLTRNVLVDTTGPSTAIDNPGLYLSGNSGSLFGTADDGAGSGLDKVQYSLTAASGPWTDATGKNNWLVSLNLDTDGTGPDTGLAEGPYTLYVRALDKAGNATAVSSNQAFQIDQSAPSLSLYKYDSNDFVADTIYGNNTLALTGTAVDSYGVQSVEVTESKVSGTSGPLSVTLNAGSTSRTWSASAALAQGEGTYILTVTVTDLVGRQTSVQKTIVKDTAAPDAPVVATPGAAGQWLSGATFNFAGSAADVGSAGVALVYYGFGARNLTPPTSLGDSFWTLASGTTSWTASVSLTGEGQRSLYLKTVDKAGNVSALQTFDYGIDQSSPSLSYDLPSGSYINGNLTLSGTASDTNSVSSVSISEKKPGDATFNFLGNATYNSGTGAWSYFRPLSGFDALPDGVYQYRITVTDAAGKTAGYDKTITQDFLNPDVTLNAPLPTIGGPVTYQGNGTLTLGGTITDTNGMDALEMQVGSGSWTALGTAPFTSFSTTLNTLLLTDNQTVSVTIRATDKAGNQGSTAYTIHVDQSTDKPVVAITGPTPGENVQSANIVMTGTISDDDAVSTAGTEYRISYDGGTAFTAWTAIPAGNLSGAATSKSFTLTVNDPSNGSKILQIRAADTGGVVGNPTAVTFTQDTGAPVLSAITPADGIATNASSFVVAGTATDSAAVVSVTYRVLKDGTQIVAATATSLGSDTDPGAGEIRTFTTPAIDVTSGSGNYQVQLVSSDGTNTRQENINVVVDRTNPTVAFSTPAAASTQNNVITLTGTGSDNRLLSAIALEIWKGGSKVSNVPGVVSGTSNWSLSFDTAAFGNSTSATLVSGNAYDITLRAVATDAVGNVGFTNLTFRIDQDTDKPTIGISTAQSPTYLSAFTVNGDAADDDGISLIEVSANGSSWTTVTAPGGGWTKNSSWNTTLAAGDGTKTLYVRVSDSSTPAIVTTSTAYSFRVDQTAPSGAFTSPAVNAILKTGEFAFTGTFADASGVTAVNLKVDSGDFSSGAKAATFTPSTGGSWNYTFVPGDLADGVRTIYLQITDASGKTSTETRAVTVDKTAPVVTITEPTAGSSAFGLVRLRGSALDATSGVKSVKIGLGKTINTGDWDNTLNTWYPATGTVSWEYVINNINSFASTTYATDLGDTNANGVVDGGETWQNIWRMYLYVRSEDTAGSTTGNVAVVNTYYLEVDPLRDRPEITVLQPVDVTSTVGGFLRIVGSSYDTNYIAKNQIAFDLDNNGVFNDAGDVWPTVAPTVDQTDANTTAWYAMTGTTSWSTVINNSGEFNPTGGATTKTIRFKVRAVDSKVAHGGTPSLAGLESVYTVTFSNQVPQYSEVSLASNDTIGGTVVLTGYVKVPAAVGMSSIRFNHDGPRLSSTELIGGAVGMRATLVPSTGDPKYEAGYDKYYIQATINTSDADLFPNNAGSMTVSLRAYDNSAFQSFQTISLSVDNKVPSSPSFTSLTEIAGTHALLQGTVSDTGVISGIKKVVFYLTDTAGTTVYRLKGGTANLTNASGQVLDLTNAAYNDYRIVIDKTTEGGSDAGAGGDNDGFDESLSSAGGGLYNWAGWFNSTLVNDGRYSAKFTAYDVGNNATTFSQSTFVANNKPVITSVVLATDLNGNGNVTDSGESSSNISANYATTNFTARGNLLGLTVNASGGNGAKRYSVKYAGVERNAALTNNVLVIDTSGIADGTTNAAVFTILVYDTTTAHADPADTTDELTATISVGVTIDNVDDIAPTLDIATFGQKYSTGNDDAAKTLGPVSAYSENVQTSVLSYTASTTNSITATVNTNTVLVGQTITFPGLGSRTIATVSATTITWTTALASAPSTSNVATITGGTYGHVEYAGDSTYDTNDADVSGEVVFKGKVGDNQKVNRITATIPGFDGGAGSGVEFNLYTFAGGALSGPGWAFSVDGTNYLTEAKGNVFNWNFAWNSSLISTVTANNVTITIKVYDAAGTPKTASIGTTVDVVPYITSIARGSAYNTIRSKQGRYALRRGEAVTINGFNLFNSNSDAIVFGAASVTLPNGTGKTSFSVVVPAAATSGNLTLTVNSIAAQNNSNLTTRSWNQEASLSPSLDGSTLWTDDRKVHIWQSDSNQAATDFGYFTGSINPVYPAMSYNSGILYGSWSNYATSNVILGQNNNTTSTTIYHSYDPLEHTDISYGARSTVVYNANTYGNGTWNVAGAGGIQIYDVNAPNNSDGSGTYPVYDMEELYHNQLLMQFINPRVVNYNSDIHISYHDTKDKSLKYAYVANADASTAEHTNWVNIDGGSDLDDNYFSGSAQSRTANTITDSALVGSTTNFVGFPFVVNGTSYVVSAFNSGTGTLTLTSAAFSTAYSATVVAATGKNLTGGNRPTTRSFIDSALIGNTRIAVGQPVQANAVASGTISAWNSATGQITWTGGGTVATGTAVTSYTVWVNGNAAVFNSQTQFTDTALIGSVGIYVGEAITVNGQSRTVSAWNSATGAVTWSGGNIDHATYTAGFAPSRVVASNRVTAAGEYSAIDVTPTDHYPVIAYYDMTNLTVKLARANSATPNAPTNWQTQNVMAAGDTNFKFSGKYVSMKIDASGYVHLVFYRNSTGDLIYMKSTNNPTNGATAYTFGSSVIIDSIGAVGIWADLSLDGTTPYISYLDSSYTNTFDGVKLAYYDTALADWETMNAPLDFEVESVRTSAEVDTGGAKFWKAAVGYASSDYYRIGYYVK